MDYLVNGFWAAFALLANMDDATFSAITATLVSTARPARGLCPGLL